MDAPESDSSGFPTPVSTEPPAYADVVVPRHLHRPFTYRIPDHLRGRLEVGAQVQVPFGPSVLNGLIVALSERPPDVPMPGGTVGRRLREIIARLDETSETRLDPDLLILTRLISESYLTPWGQCLRLILPSSPRRRPAPRYVMAEAGAQSDKKADRLSPTAREVLRRLADKPKGLTVPSLRRTIAGPVARTLATLKRRRLIREAVPDRTPPAQAPSRPRASLGVIPPETSAVSGAGSSGAAARPPESAGPSPWLPPWWDRLRAALDQGRHEAFLLEAPTATRLPCVMHAAGQALAHHRSALIVTPEIDRASTIGALARARWGERVHLLHSGLSSTARAEIWQQIRAGSGCLVVGTRSAVFAPLSSMGLLCVEDEHDPALKEEQEPRYHAREVAWMRARHHQAVLLLGSAHPSLETVNAVPPTPSDRPAQLSSGVVRPPAPAIRLVDLRQVPAGTLLSEPMVAGIAAALQAKAGQLAVMLFLNRKGFAPALSCRDCGESPRCPRCSVTLTFYRRAGRLTCPYCGETSTLPETCPSCLAAGLQPVGFGTERLEEEVRRLFPRARVRRLDRDTARTPAQVEVVRRQVSSGQLDILIGTQMLLSAAHLPAVRFVGIPYADAGLHLPDFRSAERTFQTLQDVITLAQPRDAGGSAVLQTYLPTHHVMAAIATQHAATFYDEEMAVRRTLGFPPFSHLISLRVSGAKADRVREAAERWAERLRVAARQRSAQPDGPRADQAQDPATDARDEVTILGPIESALAQLRGRYRWQLLVKSTNADRARHAVRTTLEDLDRSRGHGGLKFEVDVDPVEMV
ncbi:MAG: replication restart helicase PriA [Nitrospiraceae bacterium]